MLHEFLELEIVTVEKLIRLEKGVVKTFDNSGKQCHCSRYS